MKIKFLNSKSFVIPTEIKFLTEHTILIKGIDVNLKGFKLYNENDLLIGDYSDYKTLYRTIESGYILSNDKSIYQEDNYVYIPTLEEIKQMKIIELSDTCQNIIYNGVDIELSNGKEHFSLTIEDQLNLFGKQAQLLTNADRFEYHSDGNSCKYYPKEEMKEILETATKFVSYHTTYCNSLFQWIKSLDDIDKIKSIKYGDKVPSEFESEVLKDYNILMGL